MLSNSKVGAAKKGDELMNLKSLRPLFVRLARLGGIEDGVADCPLHWVVRALVAEHDVA